MEHQKSDEISCRCRPRVISACYKRKIREIVLRPSAVPRPELHLLQGEVVSNLGLAKFSERGG